MAPRRRPKLATVVEDGDPVSTPDRAETPTVSARAAAIIEELEKQVMQKLDNIQNATEDATLAIQQKYLTGWVGIPKNIRNLTVAELRELHPEDFNSEALRFIRERHERNIRALHEARASKRAPATATRTAAKTTLRTRSKAGALSRLGDSGEGEGWGGAERVTRELRSAAKRPAPAAAPDVAARAPSRPRSAAAAREDDGGERRGLAAGSTRGVRASRAAPSTAAGMASFGGQPLATPLPFSGKAEEIPLAILRAAKPGSRIGPSLGEGDAIVLSTRDGTQFAAPIDNGLDAIPESHRGEVLEGVLSMMGKLQGFIGSYTKGIGGKRK